MARQLDNKAWREAQPGGFAGGPFLLARLAVSGMGNGRTLCSSSRLATGGDPCSYYQKGDASWRSPYSVSMEEAVRRLEGNA